MLFHHLNIMWVVLRSEDSIGTGAIVNRDNVFHALHSVELPSGSILSALNTITIMLFIAHEIGSTQTKGGVQLQYSIGYGRRLKLAFRFWGFCQINHKRASNCTSTRGT